MKFCLDSRVSSKYLQKADEIRIDPFDFKSTPNVISKYPDKDIIIQIRLRDEIDWKEIKRWDILSRGHLILCVDKPELFNKAKEIGVRFYYGFPVETMYQARALAAAGVEYLRVGIPLFFDMTRLNTMKNKVKLRVVPNVAYTDGLPREDGVCGQWIRPEDLGLYEDRVAAIEFEDCAPEKEEALFRIYAEEHEWPGELGMIISNFNHTGENRMIMPEVTKARLVCRQNCQSGGPCRICYRALALADPTRIKDYVTGEKNDF